jgi:hypothetical protein
MTPAQHLHALDWDTLIAGMRAGAGTHARREVGVWALEKLREALGEDWPQRWYDKNDALPAFLQHPATDALAYAELVETALRLDALSGVLRVRRLLRDWRGDLALIRQLHVVLQLQVATLARAVGASAEFEAPTELPTTARPADVIVQLGEDRFITEVFSVYSDDKAAEAIRYDVDLGRRLNLAALAHDVALSGHWDVRLSPDETGRLLEEVDQAIAHVAAGGPAENVTRPGIELLLAPGTALEEGVILEGPDTAAAGWRRAGGVILGKAEDWRGSELPVWLRFDLLDGTGLFSDWAAQPIARKADWMAALLAEALKDTQTAGVVMTCGTQLQPGAWEETYTGPGGVVALRRRLDEARARETFIVPLSPTGARQAALWRRMYEAESGWTAQALERAGLPGLPEIRL